LDRQDFVAGPTDTYLARFPSCTRQEKGLPTRPTAMRFEVPGDVTGALQPQVLAHLRLGFGEIEATDSCLDIELPFPSHLGQTVVIAIHPVGAAEGVVCGGRILGRNG